MTQHKPSEYWIELLEGAGVPCGPIYSIDQVFADPQVQHLEMATTMHSPGDRRRGGGGLGDQHDRLLQGHPHGDAGDRRSSTDEVLASVGYTADEIAEMRKKGAI